MNRTNRRLILMSLTVMVWIAVIAVGSQKQQLLARGPAMLTVETEPKSVHIFVDGERLDAGAYISTPKEFQIRPGRHRISIQRDGYLPQERTVDLVPGETENLDDIVLVRREGLETTSAEISSDEPGVTCDVDDGLILGQTPLTVSDLVVGQTHSLACFPKWPAREGAAKCKFTPLTAGEDESPTAKLKLWYKQGKLKISGCDKKVKP
jgi:PEGA domain